MRLFKSENIIFICFFIYLILEAFGKFYRYPISDQLGLSINFLKYGYFFPDFESNDFLPVSDYFPGLATFFYLITFMVPDFFLFEILSILGIFSIVFFFHISIKISEKIYQQKIDYKLSWLIIIVLCLWPCKFWLFYATTFKTDTLSFALIFFSIYILDIDKYEKQKNYLKFLLSLALIVFAISLKQQSIFVIFILIFFSIFNKNNFFRIFSFFAIVLISLLYYIFYQDENLWFFNITKFSTERFFTINELVKYNYNEILKLILFILFLITCNLEKLGFNNLQHKLNTTFFNFKTNIWLYVLFFLSITGIPGFLKDGGNYGNLALSIIVLTPIWIHFFGDLKKNILIFLSSSLLLLQLPSFKGSINNYLEAKKMQNKVLELVDGKNLKILTDSASMYSAHLVRDQNEIHSVDTMRIISHYVNEIELKDFILKKKDVHFYDYLIIAKHAKDVIDLENFKLIYSNRLGYIYNKN